MTICLIYLALRFLFNRITLV